MRILNHVLGFIAHANVQLGHRRIWGFPLNILAAIVLVGVAVTAWALAIEGLNNTDTPQVASFDQVWNDTLPQDYVSITGTVIPEAVYEYGQEGTGNELRTVDKSWYPLVDTASRRVLLVQRIGRVPQGTSQLAKVTGMIRRMDDMVRGRLTGADAQLDGMPIHTGYMLVENSAPFNAEANLVAMSVAVVILILGGVVAARRNIVFQPGRVETATDDTGAIVMKMSAQLALDGNTKHRFHETSVWPAFQDNVVTVTGIIDGVERWLGSIDPDSITGVEPGWVYWASERRSAVRFSFRDAIDQQSRTAVLSTDDAGGATRVAAWLRAMAVPA